jgi:hypothetical protein
MIADLAKKGLVRPDLTIHGLRHARGNELAETGVSDAEIMSQLDQATEHAARIYRGNAARRRMADAAQDCLPCRAPKEPAGNMAEYVPLSGTRGNLRGICSTCGRLIHRMVSHAKIEAIRGKMDVTFTEP